jgi:hypothetical protein
MYFLPNFQPICSALPWTLSGLVSPNLPSQIIIIAGHGSAMVICSSSGLDDNAQKEKRKEGE